jgi:hypothetical protein
MNSTAYRKSRKIIIESGNDLLLTIRRMDLAEAARIRNLKQLHRSRWKRLAASV